MCWTLGVLLRVLFVSFQHDTQTSWQALGVVLQALGAVLPKLVHENARTGFCAPRVVRMQLTVRGRQLFTIKASGGQRFSHYYSPLTYRWPSGRAGPTRRRASPGHRAGRAVPMACSCLASGPRHGPWAVWPCRAARWARPFSPGHAGP